MFALANSASLYRALIVAGVVVAFIAGEREVHDRLWPQVAASPHDFALACTRHKQWPWVGVLPGMQSGANAERATRQATHHNQAREVEGTAGRERSSWSTRRETNH